MLSLANGCTRIADNFVTNLNKIYTFLIFVLVHRFSFLFAEEMDRISIFVYVPIDVSSIIDLSS